MPKPKKERTVAAMPAVTYFKPQGIPMSVLEQTVLAVDEYEAIRLNDLEMLSHGEAAKRMNISRPTFTRLVGAAHMKIAEAIVHGRALRIEGGTYHFSQRCRDCGEPRGRKNAPCPQYGVKHTTAIEQVKCRRGHR